MSEILKLAWRNLFRNPRRTVASLITVAFGSAGLLLFMGFNNGIMNQYRENVIHGTYGNGQVFTKGYHGKVFEKPWEMWIQNWEDAEKKLKEIPQVKEVFPRLSFYAFLVKGNINLGGRGEGVIPERENKFFNQLNFIQGQNITQNDEIVLGKGLADSLDAKVGDKITILAQTIFGQLNGTDARVAGVFHTGVKSIDDQFFRIHLKSAQDLLNTNKVELFSLGTTSVADWPKVESQIQSKLPELEAFPFEILDKIYYQNSVDFLNSQFNMIRTIILIIVALGIFNTIAVGLLERAGEVGALRANGEKRSRLFKIFIFESAYIGFLGGIIGSIIALIAWGILSGGIPMPPGPGITRHFLIYLEITPMHFLQAITLPMITAMVASIFPIRKMLKRSIPELLRST